MYVSCVPVELYVPFPRCYRLVLRPVKALLDRNFRCTVTEYVLARCSIRKPRAKSVYGSRARECTRTKLIYGRGSLYRRETEERGGRKGVACGCTVWERAVRMLCP